MDIKPGEITDILKREIKNYDREIDVAETGTVLSAVTASRASTASTTPVAGELVEFPNGLRGMILNLEEDNVGVAIMGDLAPIKEGDIGRRTGRIVRGAGRQGAARPRRRRPRRAHRRQGTDRGEASRRSSSRRPAS
jgi:F0F1-type ATP synthase alpha subunit